jgi:hypothetical protein
VPFRMQWMALRAAITTRVAVKVRGISRITSSGVLSSLISLMRRSSVVVNTAVAPVFSRDLPAKQKAARSGGLFGLDAAICQIERDPPAASELSLLKYQ